jgi:hypothetical protein
MNASGCLSLSSGALPRWFQQLFVLSATLASAVVATRKRNRRLPEIGEARCRDYDAEITVLAVRPMVWSMARCFPEPGSKLYFGEKLTLAAWSWRGSGSTLTIETTMGGTYRLNLVGSQLSGEYIQGNTYSAGELSEQRDEQG